MLRPCARPVHSPFTAVYTAVYDGCYTAVRHVHTSTTQLKGRVRAMYTAAYTGRDSTLRPWAVYTAVTRHVHGRVHVPYRAVYVFVYTGCVHGRVHGPHTAVACRLGTCTRPGRPTCRIHGPDGPCTRPCNGRIHDTLHGRVRPCRRPCRWPVHGRVTWPCIRRHVYAAVYTARTRPCTRPVYGPCTFHVHGHVHGRRRPCRHSHVHGWCRRAVCTAHTRPCTGRVYGMAVYGPCIRHGCNRN